MPSSKTRVAIIGGGVAGLVMARHVVSRPEIYSVTLFEQTDQVGGTWVYTDETEIDKNGLPVHSSMYKNLRTNLPKEIMQIPDFPFEENEGSSFVHHTTIRKYLEDYTNHFNLHPHIKLNTLVNHVEPEKLANGQVVYAVTYTDLPTRVQSTKNYDAVVLCNGHYTVPHLPEIRGADSFQGECLHSHQYRKPEKYAGKTVCILGASWSGIDICLEITKHAKKIYLSHNFPKPLDIKMSKIVEQVPGIDHIESNKFVFRDGTSAQVDVLIYCTGYEFTYPFVSPKVEIRTDNNHVEPVYKHLIHMDWPNLFLMGLPAIVIPFPMFHIQAQYILGIIEGQIKLPSSEQMHEEYKREKKSLLEKGIAIRHINKMCERQWAYYDEIASSAGCSGFRPVIRTIYEHCNAMREQDLMTYKNYQYRIIDDENFMATYCKPC